MKFRSARDVSVDLLHPAARYILRVSAGEVEGEEESGSAGGHVGDSEPEPFYTLVQDEKLREHATRFNSIDDLVKANLESRQRLSKAIVPPGKDTNAEDHTAFNRALGVPDGVEGYEWPTPPDGQAFSEEIEQARAEWTAFFLENRFSKSQAENAMVKVAEMERRQRQAMIEADRVFAERQDIQLKDAWGPDYKRNRERANRAAADIFGDDFEAIRHMETKDECLRGADARKGYRDGVNKKLESMGLPNRVVALDCNGAGKPEILRGARSGSKLEIGMSLNSLAQSSGSA